ncbi:P-loop containing nucleoside triphosphate hydrolase protein [Wallemia mellicola]|nr:P-loop containing nucleoside triphosphate hydrolase protein [Wallemia mellicola]
MQQTARALFRPSHANLRSKLQSTLKDKSPSLNFKARIDYVLNDYCKSHDAVQLLTNFGLTQSTARRKLKQFREDVKQQFSSRSLREMEELEWKFDMGAVTESVSRNKIIERTIQQRLISQNIASVDAITDFRQPSLKYSKARTMRRKLILHVGPTNSGKTHSALLALSRAKTGIYAGPLRLLAHEIFLRLNQGTISPGIGTDGKPLPPGPPKTCNLYTGEEVRIVDPESGLKSCTVEMVPLEHEIDVGVIDEIQLIADDSRGPAWTAAVLGMRAKELHICGEETVVELLERIAKETGDEIIVNRYKRLTELRIGKPLSTLKNVRKGDCVVTFSRSGIWALKRKIEDATGLRCAVAYGGLPPETRAEQAKLFNDKDSGYDVMVASDAIGMGLNLKIRRVVFETVHKWNGVKEVPLSISQMKQIAGRAGRYGVNEKENIIETNNAKVEDEDDQSGVATTLNPMDLQILERAISAKIPTINKAAIGISTDALKDLNNLMPSRASLGDLIKTLTGLLRVSNNYFVTSNQNLLQMAAIANEPLSQLPIDDAYRFAMAPCNTRDANVVAALCRFIDAQASGETIEPIKSLEGLGLKELKDVEKVIGNPAYKKPLSPDTLNSLESLHRSLVLYTWLSFRFTLDYTRRSVAQDLKVRTERCIEYILENVTWISKQRQRRRTPPKPVIMEGLPDA